jgi:hypothetical protein
MLRHALRDDQWDKIKDFLPGREGHVGGTAADNRLFVDAVIYRYRTGIPWRDLPERTDIERLFTDGTGDWVMTTRGRHVDDAEAIPLTPDGIGAVPRPFADLFTRDRS